MPLILMFALVMVLASRLITALVFPVLHKANVNSQYALDSIALPLLYALLMVTAMLLIVVSVTQVTTLLIAQTMIATE